MRSIIFLSTGERAEGAHHLDSGEKEEILEEVVKTGWKSLQL